MWSRYLLLNLLLLFPNILSSQDTEIKFRHLVVEDGLSRTWVKCVYQDSKGFMWFGTNDGLNRYDGYQFKVYKYDLIKPNGINSNNVNVIYEDRKHNLWVGTQEGLNLYNRELDEFIPLNVISNYIDCIFEFDRGSLLIGSPGGLFLFDPSERRVQQLFNDIYVDAILMDKSGNLWLGTYDGLWLLNPDDYSYIPFRHNEKNSNSISENVIRTLHEDHFGRIWIGTNTRGVSIMNCTDGNPTSAQFINCYPDPADRNSISMGAVLAICEDVDGNIWIGLENGGISIISPKDVNESKYIFNHLYSNPTDNSSLSNNSVHALYRDRQNTMWIGTYGGGINYTNRLSQKFRHVRYIPFQANSLNNNHINVIFEEEKYLWLGTEGGLNRYDRDNDKYTYFTFDPNNPNSLGSDAVWSVCRDSRGNLWVGTWAGGLNLYNPVTQTFTRYKFEEDNETSIGSNSVYEILEDREGNLWIATMSGGLNKYDYNTNTFKRYQVDVLRNSISNNWVMDLMEASNGKLWISTTTAVDVFDKQTGKFKTYTHNPSDSTTISYNGAIVVYEDSRGNIWLGTNAGLNLYHPDKDYFTHYLTGDGLPDNTIKGICDDDHGNLWLTTNNGISKFINAVTVPDDPEFRNYDMSDGLQGNEFNGRSIFRGQNGIIYAGGTNGFNTFHPDSILDNTFLSEVGFTNFSIFNKPVHIREKDSPLKKHINEIDEIILSPNHTVFTIEFSALDYLAPEKIQYAFKLEGFEKVWNYVGTQRTATYTNLDPGKYVFRVKSSNCDGLWNEQSKSLNIVILPPWWKTNLAKVTYVVLILLALYFFRQYTLISVNLKNRLWMEHLQKEKDEELSKLKFQFFTNISHELRTPLTLITGPLERLIGKGLAFGELQLIKRNVTRLRNMVDQILDFRKVENNMMQLSLKPNDIVGLIANCVNEFLDYANQKKIELKYSCRIEKFIFPFDSDKMEKILNNLLINALKYTPTGGSVSVYFDLQTDQEGKQKLLIKIEDTGKGIAPKDQENIFERFYTSKGYEDSVIGTGIGLHLTRKFVELHGGSISLNSTLGQGSEFSIEIPVSESHTEKDPCNELPVHEPLIKQNSVMEEPERGINDTDNLKTILIIDDNEDMCNYLKLIFNEDFYVVTVTDPLSGIDEAIHYMPDIIISDVMMPELDGFELCRKIKTDIRLSHIPVILLTAKATTEDHITGFETGADDYIYKPFDDKLLISRIKNLIRQRDTLKKHFIGADGSVNPDVPANSLDKVFIERVFGIINRRYADSSFSVNDVILEIGMSRSVFYKKLKAISNQSINDLIRNVRMAKAKELLVSGSFTISEVAYDTGFGDPAYFSKVFKDQYKVTPKEFKRHISKI